MAARAMKSPTSFRIGDGGGRTRPGPGGAPGPGDGRERARCGCPDGSVATAMECLPLMAGSPRRVPTKHIRAQLLGAGDGRHMTSGYTSGTDQSGAATRVAARRSQVQIPGLPHQVVTEAVMRLFVHQAEAGLFVDAPGGMQHVVCPQRELAVADLAGEAHAFLHEALADAEPPRPGLYEEQTQLGNRLRLLDAKHRPHVLPVQLRDPAALPLAVVVTDELGDDIGDQRLELLPPAVFPGIQRPVALYDPAHVARSMASQHAWSSVLGPGAEQPFDSVHGRHQALLLRLRQLPQHGADVLV